MSYDNDNNSGFLIILISFLFYQKWLDFTSPFGGWDAWSMWGVNAKYLSDTTQWNNVFALNKYAHPEYPLLLSSIQATFLSFLPNHEKIVSFAFHSAVFLSLITAMGSFLWRLNKILSIVLLATLYQYVLFFENAANYYADTFLGFIFLITNIKFYSVKNKNVVDSIMLGFLLSSLFLIKQEGMIMFLALIIFYWSILKKDVHLRNFALAMLPAIFLFIIQKIIYPIPSDMEDGSLSSILEPERWKTIFTYFKNELIIKNKLIYFICLSSILGIFRKDTQPIVLSFFSVLIIYLLIYSITPHSLYWHLSTSASRLIHHLIPTALVAFTMTFSKLNFDYIKEKL